MSSLTQQYSGVIINQNQTVGASAIAVNDHAWRNQEFFLPADYQRGTNDEAVLPELSGWQLLVTIADGYAPAAGLEWDVQFQLFGSGWLSAASGVAVRSHAAGAHIWFDMYFDNPVTINAEMAKARWRLRFRASTTTGAPIDQVVDYTDGQANVNGIGVTAALVPDVPYVTTANGVQGFLLLESSENVVTWNALQGITQAWASLPNPFAARGAKAYLETGLTESAIQVGGADVSFCFRLLGLVADEGTDYLGNPYRSIVITSEADNVSTTDGARTDKVWLSDPCPSRFGVKSLYFDVRQSNPTTYTGTTVDPDSISDNTKVIDSVLVDPLTPGVYFSIYYSTDGDAGTSETEWEHKLWTRVPEVFQAIKRESHVLPKPIAAKYIKIEFSHLQARSYDPGDFARPTLYKKHPKWVLDYFLARTDTASANAITTGQVGVIYDALDLAYSYYLDDLSRTPDQPVVNTSEQNSVQDFLANRTDLSDQVDPLMLEKINLVLQPYRQHPSNFANIDTVLGQQALAATTGTGTGNYPTESTSVTFPDVLELRSEAVVFEENFPVMFFYLTCRHAYREVLANFQSNRAYFAGIREISFARDNYTSTFDQDLYVEDLVDSTNLARNEISQ